MPNPTKRENLTKRRVDAAKPRMTEKTHIGAKPHDASYFLWCGKTSGFGVRVYPTGRKIFVAQVRVGRQLRRVTIGPFGPLTVEQARSRAEAIIRTAGEGRDPQREKRERREALTVSELCNKYLVAARDGLVLVSRFKRPKKPSTIAIDEGRVARHIAPLIGTIRACDLRRADVQRMVDDITHGKTAGVFKTKSRGKAVVTGGSGTAARVVELLGGIFTWAEKRGYVPPAPNPVRGIETVRGEPKTRVLDEDTELVAIGRVLDAAQAEAHRKSRQTAAKRGERVDPSTPLPPPKAVALSRLVAMTGWRRSEWSKLQWRQIDWDGHCVRLGDTKNGRWNRPIGETVLQYLREFWRTRTSDRWLFPNRSETGGADLKKAVAALFDAAGLPDARSHDMRRTFSTIGDDEGYSEATIGMLIGDAPRGVVRKHYIHKPDAALVAAADSISARIAAALEGKARAKVVDLAERRDRRNCHQEARPLQGPGQRGAEEAD